MSLRYGSSLQKESNTLLHSFYTASSNNICFKHVIAQMESLNLVCIYNLIN